MLRDDESMTQEHASIESRWAGRGVGMKCVEKVGVINMINTSAPKAGGRWFRLGREMFRAFTSASVPPLEVKRCAINHIHVSSEGRHILASANAAAKVRKSYKYLRCKVE